MVRNKHGQELIERIGTLDIINYYANEMGDGGYGDIATSPEDIWKAHPGAKLLSGFGVVCRATGMSPDSSDDWYEDINEVREYAVSYEKELQEEAFAKRSRLFPRSGELRKMVNVDTEEILDAIELNESDLKTIKDVFEELRIYRLADEDPREMTTNGLYQDELALAKKLGLEEI